MTATTYVIPTQFLNLAINNEVVGMEKSDFELWDNFLFLNRIDGKKGHWDFDMNQQEPYFS